MPKKIGFIVVSSSSHEDKFSAKELMVHAPTVHGWRSSRLCSFPQHITLQLVERSRIRKLQLLAHQYLIPTKVEFYIGDSLPETSPPGLSGQLQRLGYVSLADNEKTAFKSRELKSVHVDAAGTYLRIMLHRNHPNRYNHHNQVGLVAINVLGDPLDGSSSLNTTVSALLWNSVLTLHLYSTRWKTESISPFDDLAFDMYQDPEVAYIIRLLDQKKHDMVQQENFEVAKILKQAIADLQKVGERLARYDVEKRCAIEKEDYDLAKKKKELMDEYRRTVYQQLEVHNLLDVTVVRSSPVLGPPTHLPSPGPTKPLLSTDPFRKGNKINSHQHQLPAKPAVVSKHIRPPDASAVTTLLYDETPLPALQRPLESIPSPAAERPPKCDAQRTSQGPEPIGEPELLTETAQREAGLAVEVYGERLVAGAYSKTWCHREDALVTVHSKLQLSSTAAKEELRNMIRAAVFLVKMALLDKVTPVFHASLKLLRLLVQLIPGLGLGQAEVIHCIEQTFPHLLSRTGDLANRVRAAAVTFIQEIAVLKDVRAVQIIPGELVKPYKSNFPSRLAQSRAELIKNLLVDLGLENSGFTLENVITFCTAALEHSTKAVRELAVSIILSMYQQHRRAVLSYLPPSDAPTWNKFLYKTLFDGFAKLDGKLAETQGRKQQSGKKETGEIHSLQEQLAVLKDITVALIHLNVFIQSLKTSFQSHFSLCIFCGKKDESFTEDGLDIHYWKQCPMLRRCDECRQVVEIASLTEHLLSECKNRSRFSQCPRCSEAVPTEGLTAHAQGPSCNRKFSSSFLLGMESPTH
uniref:Centrosomal protein of 104 kDa n=1 Tax=Nothobranchius furzeri TaxID=105023 RepID=A0A8C6LGR9_NOTFU